MIFKGWCKYCFEYDEEIRFEYFLLEAQNRREAINKLEATYGDDAIDFSLEDIGEDFVEISIDTYDTLEV